jgi:hypothetical protein
MSLEENYKYFLQQLPSLIITNKNKFVLIRNCTCVNFFDNIEAALKSAIENYPDQNFIIQEVTDEARVNYINESLLN